MVDPSRVRVTGPLLPRAAGFAAWLTQQGYKPWSVAFHLRLMAKVSCWMQVEGVSVSALSPETLQVFLAGEQAAGHLTRWRRRVLRPLLDYLRVAGLVAAAGPPRPSTGVDT